MLWFDWMTLGIIGGIAAIQTFRGTRAESMALPLFEALGLIVAAICTIKLSGPVGEMIHMQKSTVMIVLFAGLGIGAVILGRWLFSVTGWSFGNLDWLFSLIFGIVAGWTIAHMVLQIIVASQGVNGPVSSMLDQSVVTREVYYFNTWNKLMRMMFKARLGSREMWDVDKHDIE